MVPTMLTGKMLVKYYVIVLESLLKGMFFGTSAFFFAPFF